MVINATFYDVCETNFPLKDQWNCTWHHAFYMEYLLSRDNIALTLDENSKQKKMSGATELLAEGGVEIFKEEGEELIYNITGEVA